MLENAPKQYSTALISVTAQLLFRWPGLELLVTQRGTDTLEVFLL